MGIPANSEFVTDIPLVAESGEEISAELTAAFDGGEPEGSDRAYVVIISCEEVRAEGRGPDFFEALIRLRRRIEPQGWRVLCNGASRDVWPSSLARDMGSGLKAYKCRLGEPTSMDDLVEVFATSADVVVSTVDEQRGFHTEWVESLRGGSGVWRRLRRSLKRNRDRADRDAR